MTMTRKHYKDIADEIAETLHDARGVEDLAGKLVAVFARDNPNFDARKFLSACGIK